MIKKYNKPKIFLLFILFLSATIVNICKVRAYNFGGIENNQNTGGSGGGTSNGDWFEITDPGGACYKSECQITTSLNVSSLVTINMYDMYGNEIDDFLNPRFSNEFLAGTYVGLNIYENKSYTSSASYQYRRKKKKCSCTHTFNPCSVAVTEDGNCVPTTNTYYSYCGCNSGDSANSCWYEEISGGDDSACAARAVPPTVTLEPSYNVTYRDSNDIAAQPSNNKYYTEATITDSNKECTENSSSSGNTRYKSENCNITYNREKTCINVKNGKVRYIKNSEQCDVTTEYTIKNEGEYWKYFIPLNANSAEDFTLSMESSGAKQRAAICQNIIDKHDNYYLLISDINRNLLPKITPDMTDSQKQQVKGQAKRQVNDGCYYQTIITIPINQKFYNEINNGNNFKGFNFYYKPIDINNPFPNGLNDTNLWYNWNEDGKKEPDLTKSYNEVTYEAININADKIRNYNKNNLYTDWYNMYVSGTSRFIDNEGIVRRSVDNNSYYALGCGPSNTDLETSNAFYQSECDKS